MRFIEFPNKYLGGLIPRDCCFFQVIHDMGMSWFCVVSGNNKNIKHTYKNKSVLIYKDRDIYLDHTIKLETIEPLDGIRFRPNYIGCLDLESCVFSRSNDYTGKVNIIEMIGFLNESSRTR